MVPRQGGDGRVFIRTSWWEIDTLWGPLNISRHTLALPSKGGSFSESFNQPSVLGEHRGHFIIDHSHYYCYYIAIFIKPRPATGWGVREVFISLSATFPGGMGSDAPRCGKKQ